MFAKISFVVMIMIYTKQSTPLVVDNSEMVVIGLSLKWRHAVVRLSSNKSRFSTIEKLE